jgi:hypothetical protein
LGLFELGFLETRVGGGFSREMEGLPALLRQPPRF